MLDNTLDNIFHSSTFRCIAKGSLPATQLAVQGAAGLDWEFLGFLNLPRRQQPKNNTGCGPRLRRETTTTWMGCGRLKKRSIRAILDIFFALKFWTYPSSVKVPRGATKVSAFAFRYIPPASAECTRMVSPQRTSAYGCLLSCYSKMRGGCGNDCNNQLTVHKLQRLIQSRGIHNQKDWGYYQVRDCITWWIFNHWAPSSLSGCNKYRGKLPSISQLAQHRLVKYAKFAFWCPYLTCTYLYK
jgi:hypothetical protein